MRSNCFNTANVQEIRGTLPAVSSMICAVHECVLYMCRYVRSKYSTQLYVRKSMSNAKDAIFNAISTSYMSTYEI